MPRESFSTITTTTPKTRYRTGEADRQRSTKSRRFAATETIKVVAAQQSAAISNTMREGRLDEDDVKPDAPVRLATCCPASHFA
jgi:hypothetical protein